MSKLRNKFCHLIMPAMVLLLVAVMAVFSPVTSLAAALSVNAVAFENLGYGNPVPHTISYLPTRVVELGTSIDTPKVDNEGTVKVCHAGIVTAVDAKKQPTFTYPEVGQYEWRFYDGEVLFDTYTVTVVTGTYDFTMPAVVPTVAPKDVKQLELPLPEKYYAEGKEVATVISIEGDIDNTVKLKDAATNQVRFNLRVVASLGNAVVPESLIKINADSVVINLEEFTADYTGTLKVTYQLLDVNNNNGRILAVKPLSDITIKSIAKDEVTFDNIPTATSVNSLSYCVESTLNAPAAGSAKYKDNTFSVEATTKISKVEFYGASKKSNNAWKDNKVIVISLQDDGSYQAAYKGGQVAEINAADIITINGLKVMPKQLGWYRFQFETTTKFGYNLSDAVDTKATAVETGSDANGFSYVRYWTDDVHIKQDDKAPEFKWVKEGDTAAYDDATDFTYFLPMENAAPDKNVSQIITIKNTDVLTLPAIMSRDNNTTNPDDLTYTVRVWYVRDTNGNTPSDGHSVSGTNKDKVSSYEQNHDRFYYEPSKHLNIAFNGGNNDDNYVNMPKASGLYGVNIQINDVAPKYGTYVNETIENSSFNTPHTAYQTLYFYVSDVDTVSPSIDPNNEFQISDVYLWEGNTFNFKLPSYSDDKTPNTKLRNENYLVVFEGTERKEVLPLTDAVIKNNRMTVDLSQLNATYLKNPENYSFYIYTVVRNFNGLQNSLKELLVPNGDNQHYHAFSTDLFAANVTEKSEYVSEYGYAWKRAAFNVIATKATSTEIDKLEASFDSAANNTYKAGDTVHIASIKAKWKSSVDVDGQMTAAVYYIDGQNLRAIDLVDNAVASRAEVVSAVSFNGIENEVNHWYFTPGIGGRYILVLTAKEHASSQVHTAIYPIKVKASGAMHFTPLSDDDNTVVGTNIPQITLGESGVLPYYGLETEDGSASYMAMNRKIYEWRNGEYLANPVGYYTITVKGVNDPNCVIGNKFVPNKIGTYVFEYNFFNNNKTEFCEANVHTIQVVNAATSNAVIRMGEGYVNKDEYEKLSMRVLFDKNLTYTATEAANTHTVANKTYTLGSNLGDKETTATKPAYAITLLEFIYANYGGNTSFIVDNALLEQYMEPVANGDNAPVEYLYPAIAIPNPNVIADSTSSDEVEITVKKSDGNNDYLVSTKRLNAGNNSASVINPLEDFYVFRPTGSFKLVDGKYVPNVIGETSGVYTVTYSTLNTTTTYTITIGNPQKGELLLADDFLTYDLKGTKTNIKNADTPVIDAVKCDNSDHKEHRYVTIDLSKLSFAGNNDMLDLMKKGPYPDKANEGYLPDPKENVGDPDTYVQAYLWERVHVWVTYEDGTIVDYRSWVDQDNDTAHTAFQDKNKYLKTFDLNKGSGKYAVHISLENEFNPTNPIVQSIEFTIDAKATNINKNISNTVWGVILIILSVGLLIGVVFYFVKTARATRFIENNTVRGPRVTKDKGKEDTKKDAE